MIYFGLFLSCLALMSATVYAAGGSALSLCVALVSLTIGAGLAIPAAVKLEREGKQ